MEKKLSAYINKCINKYTNFMAIECMPEFDICTFKLSLESVNREGCGALAEHFYDVNTNKHTLKIWEGVDNDRLNLQSILFHEFTHLLDTDKYSNGDKNKNARIKGYTEYHAAQVELLNILGVDNIRNSISFSMKDKLDTIWGRKTVLDYVLNSYETVVTMISREDFPRDIYILLTTMGMLFNYWGRLSICKMYSEDYAIYKNTFKDDDVIKNFLGIEVYDYFDKLCNRILKEDEIEYFNEVYHTLIFYMVDKYNLIDNHR